MWEEHILHSEIQFQSPIKEMFEEDLAINILTAGPLRSGHQLKNTPLLFLQLGALKISGTDYTTITAAWAAPIPKTKQFGRPGAQAKLVCFILC